MDEPQVRDLEAMNERQVQHSFSELGQPQRRAGVRAASRGLHDGDAPVRRTHPGAGERLREFQEAYPNPPSIPVRRVLVRGAVGPLGSQRLRRPCRCTRRSGLPRHGSGPRDGDYLRRPASASRGSGTARTRRPGWYPSARTAPALASLRATRRSLLRERLS